MPQRNPTTRPLRCSQCGSDERALIVAGAGNTRQIRGRRRRATHVRCGNAACGHEWVSVHPRALALGRAADRAATAA